MSDFQGCGTFEESVRAAVADLFVPSVLVLASHELDNHFLARTGLTVAHFFQHHTFCRLLLMTLSVHTFDREMNTLLIHSFLLP